MTEERGEYIRFLNGEVLVFKHFFKEHFPKFFAFTSRFIDDSPMKVRVVNIAGQTVRTVSLSDGYSEMTGLAEGVYIVVLEDGTCVKVLLR